MKKKLILAALLMSMAVTVFAEEEVVWEETATEDVTYAESVFEEETEQTASEDPEYVFEEPVIVEEDVTTEDTVFEEIAFDETVGQEESVFEEQVVTEEVASVETAARDEAATSVAVEGLIYTGEPQELITAQDGDWTYSLDGETYTSELPTAINAGTYTVCLREGDKDPVSITVTIAKADVVFTPPVANSTIIATASEAGEEPSYAAGEENEVGEGVAEPAYSGEEPAYADEVVFEVVFE